MFRVLGLVMKPCSLYAEGCSVTGVRVLAVARQVAEVVVQLLKQAEGDVAVEAWADRGAEPGDIGALVSEVCPLVSLSHIQKLLPSCQHASQAAICEHRHLQNHTTDPVPALACRCCRRRR